MADIQMIKINALYPHPDNPRRDIGDVSELAESIKAQGILQNLTVVPSSMARREGFNPPDGSYTIIIGHRRAIAAKQAGLTELPCTVVEMDAKQQMQTMLVENMQRSDLTVYEQAQGFQMMLDLGSTVEEIAEKSGFSTTTVRRRVKMMELDQQKLKEVSCRQLSLGDFDQLAQIEDLAARNECLDKIGTHDFDLAVQKAIKAQRIEENMPDVKAWLKSAKAKSMQQSDRWNGKYRKVGSTIYIDKWKEDGNEPAPDAESKPLFYFMEKEKDKYGYGQLELFHKIERAAPVKRSPEEIARDKALKEAWSKLEGAAALTFDLRKKFVDSIGVSKKNVNDILLGAVYAAGFNAFSYNSADRAAMNEIFGFGNTVYIPDREEKFFDNLGRVLTGDQMVNLVYALFGDSEGQMCSEGSRRDFPRYKRNVKLELIYKWLQSLGYQMSTEETALLNGEHEYYRSEENE